MQRPSPAVSATSQASSGAGAGCLRRGRGRCGAGGGGAAVPVGPGRAGQCVRPGLGPQEPHEGMEPGGGLQRRAGAGGPEAGSAGGSPALSGPQSRRRKQPPRPADFKLQVIIIGSRGVGKTSLMERFTDDTFCEACKSTVGTSRAGRRGLRASWERRCSRDPAAPTGGAERCPPSPPPLLPCPCEGRRAPLSPGREAAALQPGGGGQGPAPWPRTRGLEILRGPLSSALGHWQQLPPAVYAGGSFPWEQGRGCSPLVPQAGGLQVPSRPPGPSCGVREGGVVLPPEVPPSGSSGEIDAFGLGRPVVLNLL